MAAKGQPKGGLRIDPEVQRWQETAAPNVAAMTAKQRKDRERVRVKYDFAPDLKAAIETAAKAEDTSASQLAAFLLAWAMKEYHAGNTEIGAAIRAARTMARTPHFAYNIDAPDEWLHAQ